MGIDQGNKHAAALRGKLQAAGDLLRKKGAGIFALTLVGRFSGIMQEQRQIEHRWVFELLEDGAITANFSSSENKMPSSLSMQTRVCSSAYTDEKNSCCTRQVSAPNSGM